MAIMVSGGWRRQLQAGLRLATVFLCFVIIGWLMNGFNVPPFVYFGTVVVCCYLAWVGLDGIALTSVWVVGLMSMAAVNQHWLHGLPRPGYQYIPMSLLAAWMFALVVVWQLAKASAWFRRARFHWPYAYPGLVCVMVAGLSLGWQIYPEMLSSLTSVLL